MNTHTEDESLVEQREKMLLASLVTEQEQCEATWMRRHTVEVSISAAPNLFWRGVVHEFALHKHARGSAVCFVTKALAFGDVFEVYAYPNDDNNNTAHEFATNVLHARLRARK